MEGKKLENLDKTANVAYYFMILSFLISQNVNILKLQISDIPFGYNWILMSL